jgi:hypothetical protein
MALQSNGSGWLNGIIGTAFAAVVAWVGTVTRQTFASKGRLDVVDTRLGNVEGMMNKMDAKIDRLVDFLLKE